MESQENDLKSNGLMSQLSMDARYESFQQLDADRAAFMKKLIAENSQLKADLQSTKSDYEDQSASRRSWQSKAKDAEDKLRDMDGMIVSHRCTRAAKDT